MFKPLVGFMKNVIIISTANRGIVFWDGPLNKYFYKYLL